MKIQSNKYLRIAKLLESIFFPSKTIAYISAILVYYLGLKINDIVVILIGGIAYELAVLFMRRVTRNQNLVFGVSGMFSIVLFLAINAIIPVSKTLIASALTLFFTTASMLILRQFWKASGHVATLTGALTVLVLIDLIFIPLVILIPLVAWSRIKVGAHTIKQVIMGFLVGVIVPLLTFPVFYDLVCG